MIDVRLKSPGWIKSLEDEMSVERICGTIPTSASSSLLAEDADMADDDYDMEGEEGDGEGGAGGCKRRRMRKDALCWMSQHFVRFDNSASENVCDRTG